MKFAKYLFALLLLGIFSTNIIAAPKPEAGTGAIRYSEIEPWYCTPRINPDGFHNHFTLPTPPDGKMLEIKSIAFKNSATDAWFPLWSVDIFSDGFWLWGWRTPNAPTPTLYVASQNIDIRVPPYVSTVLVAGTYACDQVPILSIFYEFVPADF